MLVDWNKALSGKVVHWPLGPPGDRPSIPTDPTILAVLVRHKVSVRIGDNCYEVVNSRGDALQLPFGVKLVEWEPAVSAFVAAYGQ